jgi:predicted  nucleic acid-binding Zn-ribbon protein
LKIVANEIYDLKIEKNKMKKEIKEFRDRINKIEEKLKKGKKIKFEITINEEYRKKNLF